MARQIDAFPQELKVVNGVTSPAVGYKREFFDSGGSVNKATFSDSALTIANDNPIILDSLGMSGDIFLATGVYVMTLSTDEDVLVVTANPLI